ncbi:hypothetical protein TrCOL_g627, partial [Triparma columacea]
PISSLSPGTSIFYQCVTLDSSSSPNITKTVWRSSKVTEVADGKVRVKGEKEVVEGGVRVSTKKKNDDDDDEDDDHNEDEEE